VFEEPIRPAAHQIRRGFSLGFRLNAVENLFSKLTRERIRCGAFRSIVDVQSAIDAYFAEHNAHPKPFVWTKSAEAILAKLDRVPVPSECI